MSHTPGPWWVEDTDHPMGEGREVYDGFGRTASVYGDSPTAAANARLIACAPDLLAALIRMDEEFGTQNYTKSADDAVMMAQAAIKKAFGDE
jgi:hypothetical protein